MRVQITIHVLSHVRSGLAGVVKTIVRGDVPVLAHTRFLDRRFVRSGDIILVDLTMTLPAGVQPSDLTTVIEQAHVWLVTGDAHISPVWLGVIRDQRIRLLNVADGEGSSAMRTLALTLVQQMHGPPTDAVVQLVLTKEPGLATLASCVRAICTTPWEIRRPRDLGLAAGLAIDELRRLCHRAGFARVEHLITHIRVLAIGEVVARYKVPWRLALGMLGVNDSSNLRRQQDRIRSFLGGAGRQRDVDGQYGRLPPQGL